MVVLAEAVAVLQRTPDALRSLLADVPEVWLSFRAEPEAWSPHDVLGHLIHGERTDWVPRLRVILDHGADQVFPVFDREGMSGSTVGFAELLDTFAGLRAESVAALADMNLGPDDDIRTGLHPEFGEVTLSQHLATWVAHDLCHVAQIAETMAKRYREEVGPWRAYLPALDRPELRD